MLEMFSDQPFEHLLDPAGEWRSSAEQPVHRVANEQRGVGRFLERASAAIACWLSRGGAIFV